jgi:hypothetical protein
MTTPPDSSRSSSEQFVQITGNPYKDRRMIRSLIVGAVTSPILVLVLFFLNFGELDPLAWGLAIFLSGYCLLAALGIHFYYHFEYRLPVLPPNKWLDRVGAFWLVACVFGPFFSWVLLAYIPLSLANWRWIYGSQVFLSIFLPILTGLTLLRYVRGRAALIMLAILLIVTSLPVISAWSSFRDLTTGPVVYQEPAGEYLAYTRRWLPQ